MKYNLNYDPPAPVAQIKLRNYKTLEIVTDVPMLLDTGADITLLPRIFCDKIGAEVSETDFLELEGFNETTSIAYYVRLEFIFLNRIFRGNFLAYDQDEGVIGRDILNKFSILFDGKKFRMECAKIVYEYQLQLAERFGRY